MNTYTKEELDIIYYSLNAEKNKSEKDIIRDRRHGGYSSAMTSYVRDINNVMAKVDKLRTNEKEIISE